jgi:hypothetical protein
MRREKSSPPVLELAEDDPVAPACRVPSTQQQFSAYLLKPQQQQNMRNRAEIYI